MGNSSEIPNPSICLRTPYDLWNCCSISKQPQLHIRKIQFLKCVQQVDNAIFFVEHPRVHDSPGQGQLSRLRRIYIGYIRNAFHHYIGLFRCNNIPHRRCQIDIAIIFPLHLQRWFQIQAFQLIHPRAGIFVHVHIPQKVRNNCHNLHMVTSGEGNNILHHKRRNRIGNDHAITRIVFYPAFYHPPRFQSPGKLF